MKRRPSFLQVSSAVAVLAVAATFLVPHAWWLRVLLGLPLVAFLPGRGIVAALQPFDGLGRAERFTLSAGISLACTILLGFPIALAVRLGPASWVVGLAAVTLAANAAAGRRPRQPLEPRLVLPRGLTVAAVLASAFALAVLLTAAREALPPAGGEIVQFWALRTGEPRPNDVEIGVANRVSAGSRFKVRVWQGDVVLLERELDVPVGESARLVVRPPTEAATVTPLRATLTQVGSGSERAVAVWPVPPRTRGER